ncbi:hypothetical protein QUA43_26390 [Microcoleus sp. N9_B4]|uniref:hypothetical protein n=1 Tax=Microcoleus sp. N9_B4 TaxID=3055386 RepID=UPI002FD4A9D4
MRRRKFGNGFCNGCNGCDECQEEGSSATSNVRDVTDVTDVSPMEVGRRNYDIIFSGAVERCSTYFAALLCLY